MEIPDKWAGDSLPGCLKGFGLRQEAFPVNMGCGPTAELTVGGLEVGKAERRDVEETRAGGKGGIPCGQ